MMRQRCLMLAAYVWWRTNAISLDVEDLYISPEQIRIHYEFFNHSAEDQRMLVAFPVPEIEAEPEMELWHQQCGSDQLSGLHCAFQWPADQA